jgi:hypothetical protein
MFSHWGGGGGVGDSRVNRTASLQPILQTGGARTWRICNASSCPIRSNTFFRKSHGWFQIHVNSELKQPTHLDSCGPTRASVGVMRVLFKVVFDGTTENRRRSLNKLAETCVVFVQPLSMLHPRTEGHVCSNLLRLVSSNASLFFSHESFGSSFASMP